MATFVTINLPLNNAQLVQDGFNEFRKVELELSNYNHQATLYKLNHDPSTKITPYLQEALLLSQKYREESRGYFDVRVGAITKESFHFGENEVIPSKEFLKEIDLQKRDQIDLGGMGKGFGVDKVKKLFRSKDVKEAIIAASGDIYCFGECSIAVQNPFVEGESYLTFKMRDSAVSTSGNYRRFVKSKKYNHLINPKTKQSEQTFASITLISKLPNSDIDAYATAASVMSVKEAQLFLNRFDLAYILILNTKELIMSQNIEDFVDSLELKEAKE